jgi:uncharacterized protein YjiS (DUF1127 family)
MSITFQKQLWNSVNIGSTGSGSFSWLRTIVRIQGVVLWPLRVVQAQQALNIFAKMSERELQDIGLTVQDVRNSTALPIDEHPTKFFENAAAESRKWKK